MQEDYEEEMIKAKILQKMIESTQRLQSYPERPIILTDSTFEAFIKKYESVVVDCWAEWCQPCKMIAPIIEVLAKKYRGKIAFGKLNVDENRKTAIKYNIMSIPTLLVFKDGVLVDRIIGALPKPLLEAKLIRVLGLKEED